MTPIHLLTNQQILDAVALLNSPAYQRLSKIHAEYLEVMEALARNRNLKI